MPVEIKPIKSSGGLANSAGMNFIKMAAALASNGMAGGAVAAGELAAQRNPNLGQLISTGKSISNAFSPSSASPGVGAPASTAIGRRLSLFNPGEAPTFHDPSADLYRNLGR